MAFPLTYPFGLNKSWDEPLQAAASEKFSLKVIEANPVVSYAFSEKVSIGGGVRLLYAKGEVDNTLTNPPFSGLSPLTSVSRSLEGDDLQVGYNLAMTVQPTPEWNLAVTYRSEVNTDLEGDARLLASSAGINVAGYDGTGSVEVSLPAVFSLATSYSFKATYP